MIESRPLMLRLARSVRCRRGSFSFTSPILTYAARRSQRQPLCQPAEVSCRGLVTRSNASGPLLLSAA